MSEIIFSQLVATVWGFTSIVSFVWLLITIFSDDYEKKDVVRNLGIFIVAAMTFTALHSLL
jgi:hypothetical protein